MSQIHVIIGMGSNIEPFLNIRRVLEFLKSHFTIIAVSSLQTTKPIGIVDQADFFNGAVLVTTSLSMDSMQKRLKNIEDKMGRDRTQPKYGPRVIDLDIVVWNKQVVDNDYYERKFLRSAVDELLALY